MTTVIPTLNWVTLEGWQTAGFVGLSKATGLFRLRRHGETVFLGYGATPSSSITARINAYRRGAGRKHFAGDYIYAHRNRLELQICVLVLPAHRIREIHAALIKKRRPAVNVPEEHYPRR